jgi:hypothetical protein
LANGTNSAHLGKTLPEASPESRLSHAYEEDGKNNAWGNGKSNNHKHFAA